MYTTTSKLDPIDKRRTSVTFKRQDYVTNMKKMITRANDRDGKKKYVGTPKGY